jgi:hypothetical protein
VLTLGSRRTSPEQVRGALSQIRAMSLRESNVDGRPGGAFLGQ